MKEQLVGFYEAFLKDISMFLAGYYHTAITDTLTLWVEKPQKIIYAGSVEDLVLEKFLEQMKEDLPPKLESAFGKLSSQILEIIPDPRQPLCMKEFQLFLARRIGRDMTLRVRREISRYEFFTLLDNAPMEAEFLRNYRGKQLRSLKPYFENQLRKDRKSLLAWFPEHFTRRRFLRHLSKAVGVVL